ncbi:LPXTG cell wall anchor domain-containing protein [Enterococcus sp. DIV0756]|uniref:LPXTG cell wall anchor domain-containing protein n=1 Tax=Enterococcus sp. DIV0756 TaxID=2774636 RepID=UPI003F259E5A
MKKIGILLLVIIMTYVPTELAEAAQSDQSQTKFGVTFVENKDDGGTAIPGGSSGDNTIYPSSSSSFGKDLRLPSTGSILNGGITLLGICCLWLMFLLWLLKKREEDEHVEEVS